MVKISKIMFENYVRRCSIRDNVLEDLQIEAMYAETTEERTKIATNILKFRLNSFINKTLPIEGMKYMSESDIYNNPSSMLEKLNHRS